MAKIITDEQFINGTKLCAKGKHKLRENSFGIVWCVKCGLLSTSVGNVPKLSDDDKLIIKRENDL